MGEMIDRVACAITEHDGPEWDNHGQAIAAIRAMQIPSNRAVAHAADKLQMDPTKVAAVWMCIIEGELKDG